MEAGREKDIVAKLPNELATYEKDNGKLPDGVKFEPGYYCIWNNRYFIHARATLPLKDIKNGVGLGLWIEISKEDFDKYLETENDDKKYENFQIEGKLSNNWPGFENIFGVKVLVKTIKVDAKVYIWEVYLDKPRDPLFEVAIRTQAGDKEGIERIRKLAHAYIQSSEE